MPEGVRVALPPTPPPPLVLDGMSVPSLPRRGETPPVAPAAPGEARGPRGLGMEACPGGRGDCALGESIVRRSSGRRGLLTRGGCDDKDGEPGIDDAVGRPTIPLLMLVEGGRSVTLGAISCAEAEEEEDAAAAAAAGVGVDVAAAAAGAGIASRGFAHVPPSASSSSSANEAKEANVPVPGSGSGTGSRCCVELVVPSPATPIRLGVGVDVEPEAELSCVDVVVRALKGD